MKGIQKLIDWTKAAKEKADELEKGSKEDGLFYYGKAAAFSDCLHMLALLSDAQPNSEPSATIAANPMLDGAKPEPLALTSDCCGSEVDVHYTCSKCGEWCNANGG